MERIGRYEIEGELGRGGMGVVYRAKDPAIGRTVAIKTIRLSELTTAAERSALRERLFREARSAGILSHPNIITIYDAGEEDGTAYIAMEFVDGATLEQVLSREGGLERERLIPILRQTAEALDYAARNGIVHRDVKPANIMLAEGGQVKVADFGVAKILSQQMTKTDVVMGTPSYMSPEQIESKGLDGRSDQFALGVIAYELLTGAKPFAAENMASLVFQIAREEPALVTKRNTTLTTHVDSTIRRALSKQPGGRYSTCTAFVDALAGALAASGSWQPIPRAGAVSEAAPTESGTEPTAPLIVQPVTPEAAPAPRRSRRLDDSSTAPPPRGKRWMVWIFGTALAAAIGFVLTRPSLQPPPAGVKAEAPAPDPPKPDPAAVEADARPSPVAPAINTSPAQPVPVSTQTTSSPPQPAPPAVTPPPPAPAATVVDFASAPPGASVTIDGDNATCVTPCSLELPAGQKVVRFRLAGHRQAIVIIEVPQETEVNAKLEAMMGTLIIKSTPPGAMILVDGQARKEVTPAILKLPAGKHRVTLRKPGSPDEEQDVEVKDQVITNMAVNWDQ